jgi:hypothetical protein
MADDLSQPGWVQPPGRLHQHRFGLHSDVVGELLGAGGQDAGVGGRQLPVGQRPGRLGQRGRGTGPGRSGHWCGRPRHPCAAGCAASWRWSRPGGRVRRRPPPGRRRRPALGASGLPGGPAAAATPRTRSARTASVSPSRSWAASSSTAAVRAASPPDGPVECVFESMGATYQPTRRRQAPTPKLGTTISGLRAGNRFPTRACPRRRVVMACPLG